jgi:hypothetical protein
MSEEDDDDVQSLSGRDAIASTPVASAMVRREMYKVETSKTVRSRARVRIGHDRERR